MFIDDIPFINIRASKRTTLYLLSKYKLMQCMHNYERLYTRIHMYIDRIFSNQQNFVIDVIHGNRNSVKNGELKELEGKQKRRIAFKNVLIQCI